MIHKTIEPPMLFQEGDRLTQEEFHRRYEAMPHVQKAELVRGIVYLPSPARHDFHTTPTFQINGWLYIYKLATPGVDGGGGSVILGVESEVQPDGMLRLSGTSGQSQMNARGYLTGPPEFVAEVSASTKAYDLGVKLQLYQDAGVKEYVVWRVIDDEIDWFALRDGQFERQTPDVQGIHRSEIFAGLWLDTRACLSRDDAKVIATLNQGLATPEHAAFVRPLQGAAS